MYILIVFITLTAGQPAMVFKTSGLFDYNTCLGLGQRGMQEVQTQFPGAVSTSYQCLQMVKG